MIFLPRFAALGLLGLAAAPVYAAQEAAGSLQLNPALVDPVLAGPLSTMLVPPDPPLPDAVRAMIDAAFAGGKDADVESVVRLARQTNPGSVGEINAMVAYYRSAYSVALPPDPIGEMLAAAIASGRDGDVEAVAKLAKQTSPDQTAEIDARVAAYRAERQRIKDEAAAAARAKLAAAKIWQNWKGEGQIGASLATGNTRSKGLSAGLAMTRKGLEWDYRFRAQADYQRTNGRTSVERFLAEAEPQYKFSDRGFAYGLARWEQDRILGYDARWNLSAGLGYKLLDGKGLSLSLKGGPTWRQTDFTSGRDESEINALAGLDFGWQVSPTVRLTQVASTIVGERNTTASSLTALSAKLTGALSARVAYSAEIDSNPPPGIEKVDTLTRFTLVYGF